MLTIRTSRLKVGDVLASTIYSSAGSVWMTAGTSINSEARKQQLIDKDIAFVDIKNSELDDAMLQPIDNGGREYRKAATDAKAGLYTIKSKENKIDLSKVMDGAYKMVENFFENSRMFYSSDEEIGKTIDFYDKAIIVAQYSLTLARIVEDYRMKNYFDSKNDMQLKEFYSTVAVSALMHDVGQLCNGDDKVMALAKSGMNQKILERIAEKRMNSSLSNVYSRGKMIDNGIDVNDTEGLYKKFLALTENKFVKFDENYVPIYSYSIIKASEGNLAKSVPNMSIAESAILHQKDNVKHTNAFIDSNYLDDNGHETDTDVISKIIKIAASYDKLSRNAMANEKLVKPEEIITTMESASDEYDSRFLKMFKNNIPPYDVGDIVVLDNGMEGIVTSLKAEAPSKPLVAVKNPGYDTTQIGSKFFDIDLSKEKIVILGKKTIEDKEHGDIDK